MKRLADQTLYEILEIPTDASAEQVQAAYDKARALYGPGSLVTYTLMEPDEAALLEARIEDARGTLLDPDRRARYDTSLQERHGEARAAAGGSGAPAASGSAPGVPPVPAPSLEPAVAEPAPARPAILLGSALDAAGPVDDDGAGDGVVSPPRPAPILLKHAIAREAPRPDAAPAAPPEPVAPTPAAEPASPPAGIAPAAVSTPGPVVPPPVPEAWTGEALRQVREARGLSIQQICERTKITRHHLENIEGDRFASLPAQVYLRGILLTIARELRLDGQKVARSYIERLGGAAPPPVAPKAR